jgi:hypothetical protein
MASLSLIREFISYLLLSINWLVKSKIIRFTKSPKYKQSSSRIASSPTLMKHISRTHFLSYNYTTPQHTICLKDYSFRWKLLHFMFIISWQTTALPFHIPAFPMNCLSSSSLEWFKLMNSKKKKQK